MSRKRKPIPVFKSEAEERAFWERHDSTDYTDRKKAEPARFGNLKPSARPVGRHSGERSGHGRPPLPRGERGEEGWSRTLTSGRLHRSCPSGSSTFSSLSPLWGRIRVCSRLDPGEKVPRSGASTRKFQPESPPISVCPVRRSCYVAGRLRTSRNPIHRNRTAISKRRAAWN